MTDNYVSDIQRINDKVSRLGMLYTESINHNDILLNEINSLKYQLKQKDVELKEIKEEYDKLKFSKHIELSSKDVRNTRIKINRLVREIDDCIALINRQ